MTNNKTNKKLLLKLGMVTAVAAPIATVIACGTEDASALNSFTSGLVIADFSGLSKSGEAKDVTAVQITTIIQGKTGYRDLPDADQTKITAPGNITVKPNEDAPTILDITISKDLTGGEDDKVVSITGFTPSPLNAFANGLVAADFTGLDQATTEASEVMVEDVMVIIKAKTGYSTLSVEDKALFTSTNITVAANTTTLDITVKKALTGGGSDKTISVTGFTVSDAAKAATALATANLTQAGMKAVLDTAPTGVVTITSTDIAVTTYTTITPEIAEAYGAGALAGLFDQLTAGTTVEYKAAHAATNISPLDSQTMIPPYIVLRIAVEYTTKAGVVMKAYAANPELISFTPV